MLMEPPRPHFLLEASFKMKPTLAEQDFQFFFILDAEIRLS